jgi:hypothetical protein
MEAIVVIDQFILSNSSLKPTQPMLEDFKTPRRRTGPERGPTTGLEEVLRDGGTEPFAVYSRANQRASVKDLLAVPREPVMNPCL